ncbi:unnamed protein product [Rhodiola kirilowii]
MSSVDGISSSPLDKPLHQLTEDDISQLTREDCRRYLKQKGMRRPSWNKSQAIQQVISLKALLEPTPDSETADAVSAIKKPCLPRQETATRVAMPSAATEKRPPTQFQISLSVEESAASVPLQPSPRKHHTHQPAAAADLAAASPRVSRDSILPVKQLTIFYCGKVNVYDDISRDKARTLLQLAASPPNFLPDTPSDGTPVPLPRLSLPQSLTTKAGTNVLTSNPQPFQTVKASDSCQLQKEESSMNREDNHEGASSRKACVRRYLEKRKDRSRFKRKAGISPPLDISLNQRMVDNVHDEQSDPNDTNCSSSPQSSLPHLSAKCSPAGKSVRDLNLSANNTDADEV